MKVKIKIGILGYVPHSSKIKKIKNWQSELFEIISVDEYNIDGNSDGLNWEYSDTKIEGQLPIRDREDIFIAVTNVPIQDAFYARPFSGNRVCLTYFGMADILILNNIPLKNLLLKVLYLVSLIYRKNGNQIPLIRDNIKDTHDDTRCCIFDFNGAQKAEVIYSTSKPQLCKSCIQSLTNNLTPGNRIELNLIDKIQVELDRVNKGFFFNITDWIKKHPIQAIIISSLTAITLDIISHFIYEKMK